MEGARFAKVTLNRPDLRFPFARDFNERIQGQRLERLSRRAKFLQAELSSGERLFMHLGMSGRFIIEGNSALADFCLLYTSPSPRDATLSRMPSSA